MTTSVLKPTNCGLTVMMPCQTPLGIWMANAYAKTSRAQRWAGSLEVGCGTGKNTQWLTSQGPVVGLDFSSKMLNKCRVAAPTATVHLADINDTWPC